MNSKWTWTAWDGMTVLSSVDNDGEYVIYIRGTGNSINYKWVLTGSDISCIGNIENLLDYAKVTFEGKHYISLIDANVYSPAAYPAGWQEQA